MNGPYQRVIYSAWVDLLRWDKFLFKGTLVSQKAFKQKILGCNNSYGCCR